SQGPDAPYRFELKNGDVAALLAEIVGYLQEQGFYSQ
ncbi:hypothetical protein OXX80_011624, partial [Metschnikowia pulcherrima]